MKITVVKAGTIEMADDNSIKLRNWSFEGAGIEDATTYDIALAVRTYVVDRMTRARGLPLLALAEPVEPPVSMQIELDAEREAGLWIEWCKVNA